MEDPICIMALLNNSWHFDRSHMAMACTLSENQNQCKFIDSIIIEGLEIGFVLFHLRIEKKMNNITSLNRCMKSVMLISFAH